MKITASVISLNVPDPAASARFLIEHFGFAEQMSADGFISLAREDAGFNIVYLRTGLGSFKPERIAGDAGQGLLVAFVVEEIDGEYERVRAEGVPIVTPIETEPWGERYFQTVDPNGIVIQLVQWV
ncbi:VOC family protein [Nocardia yamanashiensis]|uniref:VOC family protein n=1 Tax=Nocardia yamanashiensis TaxID=209247 RepID=UPI001E4E361B|nr:VOC family protein [Nocardia yamanashiensis]UGT39348.1 VOC family protein [Nocardia yamanashiensis]